MDAKNKKNNLSGASEGKFASPDPAGQSETDNDFIPTPCQGLFPSDVLQQQTAAGPHQHQPSHDDSGGGDGEADSLASQADYCKHQAEMDAVYKRAYAKWTSQLSDSELQTLKALNVDKPLVGYHGKGAPNQDLADSPAASYEPDIAAIIDGDQENEPEETGGHNVVEALRHFIAYLLSHNNMRLTVECLALVVGLSAYGGKSMSAIAKRHGITPATVSKRCVKIAKDLGIPQSRAMRSFHARESAKKAQLKRNRRNKP